MTKWKFFAPVALVAAALLIRGGAPVLSVALGIAMAAFLTWRADRKTARSSR